MRSIICNMTACTLVGFNATHTLADPVATTFPDQTFEVLLQEVNPAFPPIIIATALYPPFGGVAVEVGLLIDVVDGIGQPICATGLIEASRYPNAAWRDGPWCDDEVIPNFSEWIFDSAYCCDCDWSPGHPTEVIWRSVIRGVYTRYRPDINNDWIYGWIAYQAILLRNLTCNPDCGSFGNSIPYINFLAAGFDTAPGTLLPIGTGHCGSDLNFDGVLDLADITVFITNFLDRRNLADRNADGSFDIVDVQAFAASFAAGCP